MQEILLQSVDSVISNISSGIECLTMSRLCFFTSFFLVCWILVLYQVWYETNSSEPTDLLWKKLCNNFLSFLNNNEAFWFHLFRYYIMSWVWPPHDDPKQDKRPPWAVTLLLLMLQRKNWTWFTPLWPYFSYHDIMYIDALPVIHLKRYNFRFLYKTWFQCLKRPAVG